MNAARCVPLLALLGCSALSGLDDFEVRSRDAGAAGAGGDGGGGVGGAAPACLEGDAQVGMSCYHHDPEPVEWAVASAFCQGVTPGAHLAALSTVAELDAVRAAMPALARTWTWLGGTDFPEDGMWHWTGDEAFVYPPMMPPWAAGEPNGKGNENCLELTPSGVLNDQRCQQPLGYLCEYTRTAP